MLVSSASSVKGGSEIVDPSSNLIVFVIWQKLGSMLYKELKSIVMAVSVSVYTHAAY